MSEKETRVGGVSFMGLLALTFIVLKLTKVIAWSWWLVLFPLWGPPLMLFLAWIAFFVVVGLRAINRKK